MLRSVWNDATVTQHVSCDERGKAEQRERLKVEDRHATALSRHNCQRRDYHGNIFILMTVEIRDYFAHREAQKAQQTGCLTSLNLRGLEL